MRWRFSMSFLLVLVAFVCVWLASRYSATEKLRQNRLRACNSYSDAYLASFHLAQRIGTTNVGPGQSVEAVILSPEGKHPDGTSVAGHEHRLLSSFPALGPIKTRNDEFAVDGDLAAGSFVFYQAIRANTSCFACHNSSRQPQLKKGQLMGFVRLTVQQ